MKLLEFIFHLGVLFAAYNFIWFFIEFLVKTLSGLQGTSVWQTYLSKAIKYLVLTNITFVFCLDYAKLEPSYVLDWQRLMVGGIILLTYLLGKFQKQQERIQFLGGFNLPQSKKVYSFPLEVTLLVLVSLEFTALYFFPQFADNLLSNWFESNIKSLENAFLLGFIFKVIGFFFLIGIFLKLLNTINMLLSGKPLFVSMSRFSNGQTTTEESEDQFSDYEEVQDEQLNEPKN
jgi:hypothetical protein